MSNEITKKNDETIHQKIDGFIGKIRTSRIKWLQKK